MAEIGGMVDDEKDRIFAIYADNTLTPKEAEWPRKSENKKEG